MKTKVKAAALPAPSAAQAAELRQRLRGLTAGQADMMRQMMRLHAQGDRLMSVQWLLQVARQAPEHPEVRLWQGLRHLEASAWDQAVEHLAAVAAARPAEFRVWTLLASAQAHSGNAAAAVHSLNQAAALARHAADWLQLSREYDALGHYEPALQAVNEHLRLAGPTALSAVGRLQRARVAKALGQAELAAADARALIAAGQELPRAWFSLIDLKTVALDAVERDQLVRTADDLRWTAEERLLLDFALGKALEDAGEHAAALAALQRGNAAVRAGTPWDAVAFSRRMQAQRQAFEPGPGQDVPPRASAQGGELIFLVGLPRSGSTLVEQVLAAHSAVEGASELPYLNQVLRAESQRRGRDFPAWVPQATAEDWTRLGQDYLRASASWRVQRPISTDKLPDNWMLIGAIRAMLPQARIIDCRRDSLETCWSCYKQLFGPGLAAFSYDFDSLAQYAAACLAEGEYWALRAPEVVRIQHYEALVADPQAQIRALLGFCGLPFEPACLDFQSAQRAIRTPSALQVRQPMRSTSQPAAGYGELLKPLRLALQQAQALGSTAQAVAAGAP